MAARIEQIKAIFFEFRFEMLAILLTAIIFGGGILPPKLFELVILPVAICLLAVVAMVSSKNQPKAIQYIFSVFAILSLILMLLRITRIQVREFGTISLIVFILFLALLSFEVFRQMIREQEVSRSTIFAAFDCYLLLGVLGAMVFSLLYTLKPDSFSELNAEENIIDKMSYFSFITLTSIGYGDITPTSALAEKLTAFFGLIGHFYSVVIVGIIVGKYVAAKGVSDSTDKN